MLNFQLLLGLVVVKKIEIGTATWSCSLLGLVSKLLLGLVLVKMMEIGTGSCSYSLLGLVSKIVEIATTDLNY